MLAALVYGTYVGVGFILSGLAHPLTWPNISGLATWQSVIFPRFRPRDPRVATKLVLTLSGALTFAWIGLFLSSASVRVVLWVGAALVVTGVLLSQLIASSAVKIVYETSFGSLALVSFLLVTVALPKGPALTPVATMLTAIGFAIGYAGLVLNFVNQIFQRADWNGETKARQIRRHILMMAYLALGIAALLMPLIDASLSS